MKRTVTLRRQWNKARRLLYQAALEALLAHLVYYSQHLARTTRFRTR